MTTLSHNTPISLTRGSFDQEHPAAITEIADVTSGGAPGEAATIAGGAISDLLAASNPCAKVRKIVTSYTRNG